MKGCESRFCCRDEGDNAGNFAVARRCWMGRTLGFGDVEVFFWLAVVIIFEQRRWRCKEKLQAVGAFLRVKNQ